MTNKTDYAPITYNCNGATVDFPFNWKILEPESVLITLVNETGEETVLNYGEDYTVNFEDVGGSIKTAIAYPFGNSLIVARSASMYQGKSFSTSTGFQADEIEKAFDNTSINLQDMAYTINDFKVKFTKEVDDKIEDLKDETETTIGQFETEVNLKIGEINDIANAANLTANEADTKANQALIEAANATTVSNNALSAANNAVEISGIANANATNAVNTANIANTNSANAVTAATTANQKADSATTTANQTSAKVDEFGQTIEVVIEAAEKIQELEGAVVEAKVAAAQATVAADNAIEAAEAAIGALDSKQDKFVVGTGLALENGVLSNTQTSANWGNITGNIENQADLKEKFDSVDVRIDELQTSKLPNATIIGTPHIEGSFVSGFSENNYLQFPFVDISQGLPFEIYFSFTTGSNITQQQNILDSYFGIALAIQNGKGVMALSSNGSSWDIGLATGTNALSPNTTYYAKMAWTGTQYTTALSLDGQTYTPDMILNSSLSPHKTTIYIGASPNLFGAGTSHPFLGTINFNGAKVIVDGVGVVYEGYADIGFQTRANVSLSNIDEAAKDVIKNLASGGLEVGDIGTALFIDETQGKKRRLNGSILDINENTQGFVDWLKSVVALTPSLATTEQNWQVEITASKLGQCGKFVIDEENATVRLPKVLNIQGLQNLSQAGVRLPESLPNIKGNLTTYIPNTTNTGIGSVNGAFYGSASGQTVQSSTYGTSFSGQNDIANFDASRSSSTYQDNAPVQQEAIQYPYFIQIATGSETQVNIINEIELNNPFTLFDSKYSDHELFNASWLRSQGQYNPKAVYVTAYEALQVEYNSEVEVGEAVNLPSSTQYTKQGLSVKLSTEAFTDYDFVLSTSDETFRLPINQQSGYLYYYVGETVQNASLIDAGRIQEQLATKVDLPTATSAGFPSNRYIDLTLGASGSSYTAPANGWFAVHTDNIYCYRVYNSTKNYGITSYGKSGFAGDNTLPVSNGDNIILIYEGATRSTRLRFIYAEGEQ